MKKKKKRIPVTKRQLDWVTEYVMIGTADMFTDWWTEKGKKIFLKWAIKRKADF